MQYLELVQKVFNKFFIVSVFFTGCTLLVAYYFMHFGLFSFFESKTGTFLAVAIIIVIMSFWHLLFSLLDKTLKVIIAFFELLIESKEAKIKKLKQIFYTQNKIQVGNKVTINNPYSVHKKLLEFLVDKNLNHFKVNELIDIVEDFENGINLASRSRYLECLREMEEWHLFSFRKQRYSIDNKIWDTIKVLKVKEGK